MLIVVTFLFYPFIGVFYRKDDLDRPSWIGFQTFFQNVKRFLHFLDFQNVCYTCMVLSFAWRLIE